MNKKTNKLLFTFFLVLVTQLATAQERENEIEKTVKKTYTVDKNVKVDLTNRFGEVRVNTWQKNEVTVEVTIKAWGNTAKKSQEFLDKVKISQSKTAEHIKFVTSVSSKNSPNWKNGGFEINYLVNMPEENPLKLINKYGATYVGDLKNKANLIVAYGRLSAGNFSGPDTEIDVSYGSVEISSVKYGKIKTQHCKFLNVKEGKRLDIVDKFGRVEIGQIEELDIELAYSKLNIDHVNNLLKVYSKYSGGRVDNVADGFEEIYIKTSFGSFELGMENTNNFSFNIETQYGSFKNLIDGVDIKKQIIHNTSGEYGGSKGNGNSKISIYASYGSVRFL